MAYYVSPRFLNRLAVHITKNYLDLPQVKVPLILGVHGRKGEGKTFQCERLQVGIPSSRAKAHPFEEGTHVNFSGLAAACPGSAPFQ